METDSTQVPSGKGEKHPSGNTCHIVLRYMFDYVASEGVKRE